MKKKKGNENKCKDRVKKRTGVWCMKSGVTTS